MKVSCFNQNHPLNWCISIILLLQTERNRIFADTATNGFVLRKQILKFITSRTKAFYFNVTIKTLSELQKLFEVLSKDCISWKLIALFFDEDIFLRIQKRRNTDFLWNEYKYCTFTWSQIGFWSLAYYTDLAIVWVLNSTFWVKIVYEQRRVRSQ